MFPSHNTAASIAKAFSWSSLQIWTVSKASWSYWKESKSLYRSDLDGKSELEIKHSKYLMTMQVWSQSNFQLTISIWNLRASSTSTIVKQSLCFKYSYSLASFRFNRSARQQKIMKVAKQTEYNTKLKWWHMPQSPSLKSKNSKCRYGRKTLNLNLWTLIL